MKKKNAYLLIALLLLIFVGCQKKDELIKPVSSNGNGIKVDTIGGALFHSIPYQYHNVIIKQVDDKYFFSEDVQISKRQFNLLRSGGLTGYTKPRSAIVDDFTYRWNSGEWRYLIASTRRTEILQAIQMITDVSNITFIELTSNPGHSNYVTIVDDDSEGTSFSNHIGCEPGNKELHLHSSQGVGTIAHEILHSLGIFHEQTRPDRDNFINVFIDRLPSDPTVRYQYNINPLSRGIGNFDFESIMLYPSVRNGVTIMERKDNTTWGFQRSYLSIGDIQGLAALYGDKFPIQGPTSFCSSAAYSISNLPAGAAVSWSVDNPTKVTLANNGDGTVTLYSGAHTNDQNAILTATISVGVHTYLVTKNISFNGSPVLDDIFCYFPLNPTNYYTDSYYIFRLTYTGAAPSQVQWSYRVTGTTTETIVNSSNTDGAFSFFSPGTYDIIARPLDPCSMISGYYEEKTIVVEPF